MNKAILRGYLGADAEIRTIPDGTNVSQFSVATTERWKDKSGQKQEKTSWHKVNLWGKMAESLQPYLTKGKEVVVEGKIEYDQWEDKESGQKRYSTKIRCTNLELCGGRGGQQNQGQSQNQAPFGQGNNAPQDDGFTDSDIPF